MDNHGYLHREKFNKNDEFQLNKFPLKSRCEKFLIIRWRFSYTNVGWSFPCVSETHVMPQIYYSHPFSTSLMCVAPHMCNIFEGTEVEKECCSRRSLIRFRTNVYFYFYHKAPLWIFSSSGLTFNVFKNFLNFYFFLSCVNFVVWKRDVRFSSLSDHRSSNGSAVTYISILRIQTNETVPSFDFVVSRRGKLNKYPRCVTMM